MSSVVPSTIPSPSSAGEKAVFELLQRLPDGCIAYHEPNIDGRRPDFVVILPTVGLLVIEVKGWYPTHIQSGDLQYVFYHRESVTRREPHPESQARGYKMRLLNEIQRPLLAAHLCHQAGTHQGKPFFPIAHLAVLSNMSDAQLDAPRPGCGTLRTIFPEKANVSRNDLRRWEALPPEALVAEFTKYFDPVWPIAPMEQIEIKALRGLVHPEIFFDESLNPETIPAGVPPEKIRENPALLKALDLQQEDFASGIGTGHRIIHGVAGSGKTLILLAHAKAVVARDPGVRILFTCYNRTLAAWLRFQLEGLPGITVMNIHKWASRNGIPFEYGRADSALGESLLKNLTTGSRDTAAFDAILVDEAQDLDPALFPCLLAAMKDPVDGDLVIVADGAQSIYRRKNFTWASLGIKARGRTISTRFHLHRNYRNSKEIAALAASFLTAAEADDATDDAILSLRVDPSQSIVTTGAMPLLLRAPDRTSELRHAWKLVSELLAGSWQGRRIRPLQPEEIGVLYPSSRENEKALLASFVGHFTKAGIPATWLNDPKNPGSQEDVTTTGLKLQTVHSAKGLQYRAVILLWADKLPSTAARTDPEQRRTDRRLFYVGLTRAESFLALTSSGMSGFVDEIAESGSVAGPQGVATSRSRVALSS